MVSGCGNIKIGMKHWQGIDYNAWHQVLQAKFNTHKDYTANGK